MTQAVDEVLRAIDTLPRTGRPGIVAIDGRCASGKTTLAGLLARRRSCTVFHMDDYFLRPEQRTRERLAEPGGNVDHERFAEEVLIPLHSGAGTVTVRAYDCKTQSLDDPVTAPAGGAVIVEGSYSCHPALWDYADLHVFLTVSPEEQMRRIVRRNGVDGAAVFRDRWIPLEEAYFRAFGIEERCDLRFSTEE